MEYLTEHANHKKEAFIQKRHCMGTDIASTIIP